jgi:hypothetical protein
LNFTTTQSQKINFYIKNIEICFRVHNLIYINLTYNNVMSKK